VLAGPEEGHLDNKNTCYNQGPSSDRMDRKKESQINKKWKQ